MKTLLLLCGALQFPRAAFAQIAPFDATLPAPLPNVPLPNAPLPTNQPPVDYPGAIWIAAAAENFGLANRPRDESIDMVIVHDIEGPASSAIRIFQNPARQVSAHYIVGGDGQVFQMVREHNVAWHAGNRGINHRAIGIETEGYAFRPGWYNPTTYEAEARLVRDITRRYGIPRDRTHIIGHAEVPNPKDPAKFGGISGHTDPGPYWNWPAFMTLVRNDARRIQAEIPATIRPGEVLPAVVTIQNSGDDVWPVNTARDPNENLQASGPLVMLGTTQNRISPFFGLKSWMGPSLAASAASDTLPGDSARFNFTLTGPRALGRASEELRLTTVPTLAQGGIPVSFGDTITISTRVVPWVIDVLPDVLPALAIESPAGSASVPLLARWSATLPLGGIYAVYAAPPRSEKTRGATPFRYQINAQDGAKSVAARPEDGGKGWLFAGYFSLAEPSQDAPTATVELKSAPRGAERNAGAMRFIGPFPAASNTAPELSQIPGATPIQNR